MESRFTRRLFYEGIWFTSFPHSLNNSVSPCFLYTDIAMYYTPFNCVISFVVCLCVMEKSDVATAATQYLFVKTDFLTMMKNKFFFDCYDPKRFSKCIIAVTINTGYATLNTLSYLVTLTQCLLTSCYPPSSVLSLSRWCCSSSNCVLFDLHLKYAIIRADLYLCWKHFSL